jgi:hypothetical protein
MCQLNAYHEMAFVFLHFITTTDIRLLIRRVSQIILRGLLKTLLIYDHDLLL